MACGNCKKDYLYKEGEGLFCHSCTSKVKPLWTERPGTFPTEWEIYAWELEDKSLLHAETKEESADSDVDEIQWGGGNRTPSPERQAAPACASDDEWGEKIFEESFALRARFKFQKTKRGATGTPRQATRKPGLTAISTSMTPSSNTRRGTYGASSTTARRTRIECGSSGNDSAWTSHAARKVCPTWRGRTGRPWATSSSP